MQTHGSPLQPGYLARVDHCAAANDCPYCGRALANTRSAPQSVTACGMWGPDPLVGRAVQEAAAVPLSEDPYPPLTPDQEQLIADHLTYAEKGASR